MTAWVGDWLRAFGWTLAVELAVAMPLLRRAEALLGRRGVAVLFANLTTHPLVWLLFPGLSFGHAARVGISEAFAVGVETGFYWFAIPALRPRRALLVSLLANAASFGIGLALRAAHLMV